MRPLAKTNLNGTQSRGYDHLGRLTSDSSTQLGGLLQSHVYDASSNPTTFAGTSGLTNNYDDQRTNTGTYYSGTGCPTTYNGVTASYDREKRLTSFGSNFSAALSG